MADFDEYRSGERKEDATLAISNLVRKRAGGLTAGGVIPNNRFHELTYAT